MKVIDPANFDYCHEKQRRIVNAEGEGGGRHILVNGCAGCRKTQTLVFRAIREAQHKGRNVIILTFVGSVTAEIMERIEREIDVKFFRRGNHYFLNFPQGNTLEVANYDAMIHKQLQASGDPIVHQSGDWFSEKTRRLLNKIETGKWNEMVMVNNARADYLLVDEFQDMALIQAQVLGEILKRNKKIGSMVLGDYLQSIFGSAEDEHAMDYWRTVISPKYYQMEICFRCPPNHIRLSNLLLEEERKKRLIPNMTYPSWLDYAERRDIRPIAFTHPPLSGADNPNNIGSVKRNTNARVLSDQIIETLNVLRGFDPFKPEDVCIIMSKVNNNAVFIQLKNALDKFYRRLGWNDGGRVAYFETRSGDDRYSIDWSKAGGKSVLASIHGIKGKGYPIIFFLGLTEGCLPQGNRLFKSEELIDHSLLNVALTRSTKWLFVGFAGGKPSRYLFKKWRFFLEACALSWSAKHQHSVEERLLCSALFNRKFWVLDQNNWRFPYLNWDHYLKEPIERPNKFINTITEDVINAFDHPKDLEFHWKDGVSMRFGAPQEITPFPEMEMNLVWGTFANLILMREHSLLLGKRDVIEQNIGFFVQPWNNIYIPVDEESGDGDKFLNIIHDLDLNMAVKNKVITIEGYRNKLNEAYREYQKYIEHHPILQGYFQMALELEEPKIILPTFLRSKRFQIDALEFLSANKKLKASSAWNVAVAYSFISGEVRRPQLAQYFNYDLDTDLEQFYENVRAFLRLKREELEGWKFENLHFIGGLETNADILKRMGLMDGGMVEYGIKGRSDIISLEKLALYEIKNSVGGKVGFNNNWAIQSLCYYTLPLIVAQVRLGRMEGILPKWRTIEIVDIRQGMLWKIEPNEEIRRWLILSNIVKHLGYIEEHQKRMLGQLKAYLE